MSQLKALLENLLRPDVTEIALATGRNPCVKIGGVYEIIDRKILSSDDILQMLTTAGGSRHVDNLGPKPVQWGCRVDGIGPIAIAAVRNPNAVQARLTRLAQDPRTVAASAVPAPKPTPQKPIPARPAPASPSKPGAPPSEFSWSDLNEDAPPQAPAQATLPTAEKITAAAPVITASPSFELDLDDDRPPAPARTRKDTPRPHSLAITLDDPADPTLLAAAASAAHFAALALDDVLLRARADGASDVHLVASRPPLLRIGGKLLPRGPEVEPQALERMLESRIPERLRAQLAIEGSCDFALDDPRFGRSRVNVTRQRTGLKASFRLVSREIPTLAELGLPDAIALATRHHQGLIVITGPTGHGKTTTLAAIVDIINSETSHHIITVEDPIEYVHPRKKAMMSQREVGSHTRDFQSALKASLREDPDVIVVGELRDTETVRMALSASETGHLVLGTMNTPSAAKTIDRLIDLFPPGDQQQVRVTLAGGLRLVVSQRLLPRKDGPGMIAAAEMLPGSVPLWNLIRESKTWQIPSLQQRGKGFGIVRLDDSLADLVRAGKASLEDALLVAEAPDELEAALAGKRASAVPQAAPAEPPKPAEPEANKGLLGRAGALFGKKGGA
ncbi:type IV pilus twitching motility protein PilT [Polyangium jinanense]|uniref:PilT/PilU family type 4a pilus ATPase n=1 Tax=Polyangium jinanense TaxID=2829994 RepID=A0A9X3X5Q3_9BACT|nr:PilT/PilU family type 4a pilus ATPase [Polyangium jinanense]MDC3984224.1 PilT/PilU family type 4a pilus ATPase [Polyangium jinanense]